MKEKLEKIKKDGLENLQFVLDFDRTITGPKKDGSAAPPLVSFLRESDYLGEEYRSQAQANFETYHPIELSASIDTKEKTAKMEEWWNKHLKMIERDGGFGLTRGIIEKIVNSDELRPRDGIKEVFEFCAVNKIPVIIFSAGILGSESILGFLKRYKFPTDSLEIVTNELIFDTDGFVVGHKKPIVHSENKSEDVIKQHALKRNTILFGDGLGDATMVHDGIGKIVLRIAVSDEKNRGNDEKFKKDFDVVWSPNNTFFASELLTELSSEIKKADPELKLKG